MQSIPGQHVSSIPGGKLPGLSSAPSNIPGMQGIPAQGHNIPNGSFHGVNSSSGNINSGQPLGNMDYVGLNRSVGAHNPNRNQNANPTPSFGGGNVVTQMHYGLNGQTQFPLQQGI